MYMTLNNLNKYFIFLFICTLIHLGQGLALSHFLQAFWQFTFILCIFKSQFKKKKKIKNIF